MTDSPDTSTAVSAPMPACDPAPFTTNWLAVTNQGKVIGARRHLIVTHDGKPPVPRRGWHTKCDGYAADGPRTGPGEWGDGGPMFFAVRDDLPLCSWCERPQR